MTCHQEGGSQDRVSADCQQGGGGPQFVSADMWIVDAVDAPIKLNGSIYL